MILHPPPFAVLVKALDDRTVRVEVEGEIDLVSAPEFRLALGRAIAGGTDVILDFSRTSFIDSSAVKVLIEGLEQCEAKGAHLLLAPDLPRQVRRVFEITHLETVLPVVTLT